MNHSDYGPIGLLVIQSTSLCNLDCSFRLCVGPRPKRRRSDEVVARWDDSPLRLYGIQWFQDFG